MVEGSLIRSVIVDTLWENEDENGDKQTGLSDNNSFLHDNVD